MNILLVEPFFEGSHAAWAEGYRKHSTHQVELLPLTGRFWKWRMHGGAVTLARRFLDSSLSPDLILASDMLDLTTFLALTRERTADVPTAVYFHENQLSYPWSPDDPDPSAGRDRHYGFINYTTALAADRVFFNSRYHLESFLGALPGFLAAFPDHRESGTVDDIRAKSAVLHLGLELSDLGSHLSDDGPPLVLWNHRWEYDKNPEAFFRVLTELSRRGAGFRLAVLGRSYGEAPPVFQLAREELAGHIVQFGHVESREEYVSWLRRADILPVTSNQDFFGASIVEAIHCGAFPLLPRRLTYPELIPESMHDACLYGDEDDLVVRLARALVTPSPRALTQRLRSAMNRFDWMSRSSVYDDHFRRFRHVPKAQQNHSS
jgi:glycosyltransferase involved in cell wall biosynthesis